MPAVVSIPNTPSGDPLLQLGGATLRFGGLTALSGVDLTLHPGELCGLIGPNGAGKTTIFNLITGVYPPSEGAVFFAGRDLRGLRASQIAALGVARTFQNIRLFGSLSVFDNVRTAANLHRASSPLDALLRLKKFRDGEKTIAARTRDLLALFNLLRFRDAPAQSLPYGEQRRLEIVRALATQPKLLLLDEPAAGMNAIEKASLVELIQRIRSEFSLAILLVEHSMRVVMGVCERIAVLDHGEKIAEGSPVEIQANPRVIEAYLGEDHQKSLSHH